MPITLDVAFRISQGTALVPSKWMPFKTPAGKSPGDSPGDGSYHIIIGGATQFSGGTSAASPLIAGMIGLLNDARLRAGQPLMGFLNPWLYGAARGVLTDVTDGASRGCNGYDTQTGTEVPGAGVVGEMGAFWNATAGELSCSW